MLRKGLCQLANDAKANKLKQIWHSPKFYKALNSNAKTALRIKRHYIIRNTPVLRKDFQVFEWQQQSAASETWGVQLPSSKKAEQRWKII